MNQRNIIAKAGLVSILAIAGCLSQERSNLEIPPQITIRADKVYSDGWTREGQLWYRNKFKFKGKEYSPNSFEKARKIEEMLNEEYFHNH